MKFLLETDSVSNIASSIKSQTNEVSSIASNCNSYDTSCEDGFDFAGAKSTIVANVNACADRISATGTIINNIVEGHLKLQSSFTFENYLNPPKEPEDSNDTYNSPSGSRKRSRSGNPGGSYYGGGYSNGIISGSQTGLIGGATMSGLTKEKNQENQNSGIIKNLSYAMVDKSKLTSQAKKIIDNSSNSSDGYIMVNNRYALACDPSVGKEGDVLKFTTNEGKTVECVVAVNTVTSANKNKGFLLVNNEKSVKPVDFSEMITDSKTKVENLGSYTNLSAAVENKVTDVSKALTATTSENQQATTTKVVDNTDSSNDGGVMNA